MAKKPTKTAAAPETADDGQATSDAPQEGPEPAPYDGSDIETGADYSEPFPGVPGEDPEPDPDFAEVEPLPGMLTEDLSPPTMVEELSTLMAGGLAEDEALLILNNRRGLAQAPAAATPGGDSPLNQSVERGIDQAAQERLRDEYAKRMVNHAPPQLPVQFTIELRPKYADYVERVAQYQSAMRRREMSVEEALSWIVLQYWKDDSLRLVLENPHAKSGPRDAFNPGQEAFVA